ncbi:hypothetical protein JTB14_003871 [Gonioctena quinquepunctata]|nr:hypothetical protein JTB14_003871 [Gonioctena quinquepunctata]
MYCIATIANVITLYDISDSVKVGDFQACVLKYGMEPTTDIQIVDSETSTNQVINEEVNEQNSEIVHPEVISEKTSDTNTSNQPQCSCMPDVTKESTSFPTASPKDVLAIPKVQQNKRRTSRTKGKTTIVSSSPYLQEFKEGEKMRQ